MIAPRDSWMMPPPCNEMIAPGRRACWPSEFLSPTWLSVKPFWRAFRGRGVSSRLTARCDGRCGRGGREWRPRKWGRRQSQDTPVLERMVSDVTVTDPKHSLFGQRFTVLPERSGRGPGFCRRRARGRAAPFDPDRCYGSGASVGGGRAIAGRGDLGQCSHPHPIGAPFESDALPPRRGGDLR